MTLVPDAWLVAPARFAEDDAVRDARSPALEEQSLLARARARDEAALRALYREHAPSIHRFLGDLLGDAASAADATQETFARAFRRLDTLREGDRLAPWLFGVARNVSREHRKARRRQHRVIPPAPRDVEHDPPEPVEERTPEAEILARETASVVQEALAALSEDRRAALLLRLDHGLACDEIAGLMGWSLAKVKVEIFRARQVLREVLDRHEGGSR